MDCRRCTPWAPHCCTGRCHTRLPLCRDCHLHRGLPHSGGCSRWPDHSRHWCRRCCRCRPTPGHCTGPEGICHPRCRDHRRRKMRCWERRSIRFWDCNCHLCRGLRHRRLSEWHWCKRRSHRHPLLYMHCRHCKWCHLACFERGIRHSPHRTQSGPYKDCRLLRRVWPFRHIPHLHTHPPGCRHPRRCRKFHRLLPQTCSRFEYRICLPCMDCRRRIPPWWSPRRRLRWSRPLRWYTRCHHRNFFPCLPGGCIPHPGRSPRCMGYRHRNQVRRRGREKQLLPLIPLQPRYRILLLGPREPLLRFLRWKVPGIHHNQGLTPEKRFQ